MRWFGPSDPVKLSDIRQAGCEGVVTALHQIPVGDVWSIEAIKERCAVIEAAGMSWTVIESLPVSDDIKRQKGDYLQHIENYKQSLRNVAACGLKVVTYNFMPVLDWLRTDVDYEMPDGSKALYFDRLNFIAFDLFMLERPNAASEYTHAEVNAATQKFSSMSELAKEKIFRNAMMGLPGSDVAFTPQQVLEALNSYNGIDAIKLKQHLFYFLKEVVPVASECGLKMAIHPDDPPYAVLGLPRIMSTHQDAIDLINAVPDLANGFCFCTGSFGARPDNDILAMIELVSDRIHFLHLRNTKRDDQGNFFEADHLAGDTNMASVVNAIVELQQQRKASIPMRPDHGHQMLDDLQKQTYPGYSAIGRLKGLAELRGLEFGLASVWKSEHQIS